ncbi:aminoacyl-tRNA hydrolase [Candidatus Fermentibacteria bacterium]|jgi:PTH1 family peptidyl-tRNA hydrolase|nr:MAG: aminoacyl-tRNA hydrolase [Candidatus Fermentibacteria bacterium]
MCTSDSGISIILCLGNPGLKYALTWHNAGFWVADILAREAGVSFKRAGAFEIAYLPGGVHLVKPSVYMNESGRSAGAILTAKQVPPENMLVVCDDVNIPLGSLRLRKNGSSGGQNGLKNVIDVLKTQEFPRLRIGIGPKPEKMDLAKFVLKKVPKANQELASVVAHRAADCVLETVNNGVEAAQAIYNGQI